MYGWPVHADNPSQCKGREQIEQGLDGHPQAASRARVILRDLLGEITLAPGDDGSLWASYAMQPAVLLRGAGTGGRGDRI
jgi:hypothetical protein